MYEFYNWRPHVPVAARRHQAARELAALRKSGQAVSPVVIQRRTIASTFWGKAWCDNLERYSDYSNRLPRGRSYVRNGSVIHLQVEPGLVTALVSGSEIYRTEVRVAAIPTARWKAVCRDCTGEIDSLVELLQGQLSRSVMQRVCQEKTGLFPVPSEIEFSCSCPDWASMCKHVAAVLYGVGARLDLEPALLFALRQVELQQLITQAGTTLPQQRKGAAASKVLVTDDLSSMFGIEMAESALAPRPARKAVTRKAVKRTVKKATKKPTKKTAVQRAVKKAVKKTPVKKAVKKTSVKKVVKTPVKTATKRRVRKPASRAATKGPGKAPRKAARATTAKQARKPAGRPKLKRK
jgi:uncharacterized Zn finger protein